MLQQIVQEVVGYADKPEDRVVNYLTLIRQNLQTDKIRQTSYSTHYHLYKRQASQLCQRYVRLNPTWKNPSAHLLPPPRPKLTPPLF